MGANDPQYGNLTPEPEPEQEKKKKKGNKKKALLLGLAALLAAGGCYVGTTLIDRPQPPREEEVVTMVAPTETQYVVPLSPTPTEAEPIDVREGWYGTYLGKTTGTRYTDVSWNLELAKTRGIDNNKPWGFEDISHFLKIKPWEDCGVGDLFAVCNEDLSWALYAGLRGCSTMKENHSIIRLYLPEILEDAPGLTITESELRIEPTEGYPYDVVIEKVNGQLRGHINIDWTNREQNMNHFPERWELDEFKAEPSTLESPCELR